MFGILIKHIYKREAFYDKILEFYVNLYNEITLDLYLHKEDIDSKELRKFIKSNWINRILYRNFTYKVNVNNVEQFKYKSGNISSKSIWGLLNDEDKSLIFNGYGETLFSCYSKTESDKLLKQLKSLVEFEIIQEFEVLEDED